MHLLGDSDFEVVYLFLLFFGYSKSNFALTYPVKFTTFAVSCDKVTKPVVMS